MAPFLVHDTPIELRLGAAHYDLSGRPLVMGILNRTRDSFFDNGRYFALDDCLRHAEELVEGGADIVDVGGVRAGPGPEVTEAEECDRVLPVIEALTARFDVPVSVDTFRSGVAREAFSAGAVLGNDISGFADPAYLAVAAAAGASVVATHIRLAPRVEDPDPRYPRDDVVGAVEEFLLSALDRALEAGLSKPQVVFDAGFDLGKTTEQSLALLAATERFARRGQPVLLAASNKGFLGELVGLEVSERGDISLAAAAYGTMKGARILRSHDARATRRLVNTLVALLAR